MSRYFYFLHAFKLPSALIAQGLAEKNTGAKRGWFFFQPTAQRAVALPNQRRKATFASKK